MVVDTRGFFCPMPVIKTSDALENLDPGSLVEVISDDPAIEFDLPAWCQSNGHTIQRIENQSGVYRYWVKKRSD
jgi:tRNA 2-thiouridine synthesizing protein A